MQLKTILNRVQKHRSFVYGAARLVQGARLAIGVEVRARANSRAKCSGCGYPAPGYDTLPARRFEFVPLWGIAVFWVYAMRRVSCASCGVRVESVPWATGKHPLTDTYAWFLARWARRLSWKEVAEVFHTSWEKVFRAVEMAVEWGRAHQDLSGIEAIGIDEIQVLDQYGSGHYYGRGFLDSFSCPGEHPCGEEARGLDGGAEGDGCPGCDGRFGCHGGS